MRLCWPQEQCGTSQLAPASKQMIEQQMTEQHVRPLQDSLAAAQERCDSLQAHIQVSICPCFCCPDEACVVAALMRHVPAAQAC